MATPLTTARRVALEGAQAMVRASRIGEWRGDAALLGWVASLCPARKPAWGDKAGRALCSLRDWLAHGFPEPMPATVREIDAALAAAPRCEDPGAACARRRALDALWRQKKEDRTMDTITACLIAEGAEEASLARQQEAWSHLIGTGTCWQLQGWYGRTARGLIDDGEFSEDGEILNPADAEDAEG